MQAHSSGLGVGVARPGRGKHALPFWQYGIPKLSLGNLLTVLDGLINYSSMNKVTDLIRIS